MAGRREIAGSRIFGPLFFMNKLRFISDTYVHLKSLALLLFKGIWDLNLILHILSYLCFLQIQKNGKGSRVTSLLPEYQLDNRMQRGLSARDAKQGKHVKSIHQHITQKLKEMPC